MKLAHLPEKESTSLCSLELKSLPLPSGSLLCRHGGHFFQSLPPLGPIGTVWGHVTLCPKKAPSEGLAHASSFL